MAPEEFLASPRGLRVALDEIHRLDNPSELLKIAADHFPETKILATGSSTLGASAKFKDTLTGRKRDIWLSPMILEDWEAFENLGWDHRFIRGVLLSCIWIANELINKEKLANLDNMKIEDRITIDPTKRSGKACIRNLRITVADVLSYLASGMSEAEILADFPELEPDDIRAALTFAAERENRMLTA
jgi:uncharacterized protein (DUF433 family)